MAAEKPPIQVESYQKIASLGGWSGSGRGLWAISTVGAVLGAIVGTVAPLFPILAGATTLSAAVAAMPVSIAAFAATGLVSGFHGGLMLGRISGATATVAEEQERRMKEWTARQIQHNNPGAEIVADAPKENPPAKPFWKRVKDTYYTYVNPRVGLAMTTIGVVGGLILGAAFLATGGSAGVLMSGLETLTGVSGIAANTPALLAYSAGVCGTIGAMWSVNVPKIVSHTTEFYGDLISGKLLGREWKPPQEPEAQPVQTQQVVYHEPKMGEPVVQRSFVSFQELVTRPPEVDSTLAKR